MTPKQMNLKRLDESLASIGRNFPDLDRTANGIAFAIYHLSHEISLRGEQVVGEYGISWGEYLALSALRRDFPKQPMSPSSISEVTKLTSGGVSNVLRRLAAKGLVHRTRSTSDGRGVQVRITEAGVRIVNEALPRLLRAESASMSRWPNADRKRLYLLLRALVGGTPTENARGLGPRSGR